MVKYFCKKYIPKFFFGLLVISLIFTFPVHSFADSDDKDKTEQSPAGFTVESIIPDNQVDTTKTYFHLALQPNSPQTIQVKIRSLKKEPVTVAIDVHNAVSSSVGAIDYAQNDPQLDPSLSKPITSFVKVKSKDVVVQNFEEKIVEIDINPPKKAFSGVKLGSLRFTNKEEAKKRKNELSAEYAYVIALMVTEDEKPFNHGANLHLKNVKLRLSNGRKVIAAKIQNDQPKVLQKMKISGQIINKGNNKKLFNESMENFSVAPNSNFNFEIPVGVEYFKPGTYVFKGKAEGDDRIWKWERTFTVDKEEANETEEKSVFKITVPKWVPWVAIVLIIGMVVLFVYLFRRQNQWKKERE
ncbi:DUF916 and DUF3324 domain-containing protein [Enterococcus hulanensis]|uniref:DUF916 and DUF3324 domain-containing protein n=1 Tax=Enterococcus TaxID=1350 RepID=UPI000B5A2E98|nr:MULTISPECIES: DUF916 and DUF3324 domain-containing protein [Enterococcus]MBO0410176.1 DUF916 and DUF3324 domain-containing protein [Enterococcus hulanensis]OTO14657.1 hypothetical protein A5875_003814 [Enterococcus sp. 3H8_DIV0648]